MAKEKKLRPPTKEELGEEEEEEEEKRKKLKVPEISNKTFKTILFSAVVAIILFAYTGVSELKIGLLSVAAIFAPNLAVASFWGTVALVIYGLIILAVAYSVWRSDSIIVGIVWVGLIVGTIAVYPIASSYAESTGVGVYIGVLKCTIRNLGDPAGMQSCQVQYTSSEPETEKIGSSEVIKVSFDTSYTGLTLYGDSEHLRLDMYSIPIEVENPSDEKPIKNFYISSAEVLPIDFTGRSEKKPIGNLVASKCTATKPCEIGSNEKIRISLRGTESIEDTETEEVEIRLKFSYDYSSEGQNDFIIANTFEDLEEARAKSRGSVTFEGPVETIVYFSPESIVLSDIVADESDVYVYISLSKEETVLSYADIKSPIRIIREIITEYEGVAHDVFEAPTSCEAPWATNIPLTSTSIGDELELDESRKLQTKQLYTCKYKLSLKEPIEKSKTIKFIVRADYSFVDTKIQRNILVTRTS